MQSSRCTRLGRRGRHPLLRRFFGMHRACTLKHKADKGSGAGHYNHQHQGRQRKPVVAVGKVFQPVRQILGRFEPRRDEYPHRVIQVPADGAHDEHHPNRLVRHAAHEAPPPTQSPRPGRTAEFVAAPRSQSTRVTSCVSAVLYLYLLLYYYIIIYYNYYF